MLTLVIPVYKNEGSISTLLDVVTQLDQALNSDFEVIFVVDGSPDHCNELLEAALPEQSFKSTLILLSRNFGSFMAIRTGLQHGCGDRYAVMAADLQEPPELVLEMNRILCAEPVDVVVGVRESRNDPLLSRLASQMYWNMYRRYIVSEMPPGGVDVFGCNKAFLNVLLTLEERHSSLVAQIFWLGFRRKIVPYKRLKRQHGKSAWVFRKKVNYLLDSVFSFSDLPIRLLIRVGGGGSILALLVGLIVFFAKLNGIINVPGYTMTMLVISLLGSLNLLGLGIVGSYAWRAYENTKHRPLAIPMKVTRYGIFHD